MRVALFWNRDSTESLGNLGETLFRTLSEKGATVFPASNISEITTKKIDAILHCRRIGNTLQEVVEFAEENTIPLVNLSTGLAAKLPDTPNFQYIVAPNAAIEVIQFLIDLEQKDLQPFEWWIKTITEHHQIAKTSLPGTAVEMARILWIHTSDRIIVQDWENYKSQEAPYNGIVSVRDWNGSRDEFGIPDEYQWGYGVHRITFHNPEDRTTIPYGGTQVFGRNQYAEWVFQILRGLKAYSEEIPLGITNIVDFVRRWYHQVSL